jgi:hypothetical protein
LELPKDLHTHPVQPILPLFKAAEDRLLRQIQLPLPPVIVNGEEGYEVEHIKDSRIFRRLLQYLVKWKDYDERNWEPAANMHRLQAIDIFHKEPVMSTVR